MTGNGNTSNKRYSFSKAERPAYDLTDPDLLKLQQILFDDTTPSRPSPNLQDLSVEELETLLAQKKAELARQPLRPAVPARPAPSEPKAYRIGPVSEPLSSRFQPASPLYQPEPAESANGVIEDVPTARFAPASLVAAAPVVNIPVVKKVGPLQRLRNLVGYTLEALVVIAAIGLSGNWLLQQAGVNLNFFSPTPAADFAVAPSRPEGLFLSAHAGGIIALPPTAVPATATPVRPTATARPDLSPVVMLPTATPALTPTPENLAVAPTPTPAIVQPVKQSAAEGAAMSAPPPAPARRLIIPRISLDTAVQEVTVNLGTWQVADFVAGHNQGTALPGQAGNMVLVGHRDIRGSIFLRLNELQKGDTFKVITDNATYQYKITEVKEVAPTEISVMAPTIDPTATLITCTPIGLATRRLILKAVLEK